MLHSLRSPTRLPSVAIRALPPVRVLNKRSLVPGRLTWLNYGSGHRVVGVWAAKNPRVTDSYHIYYTLTLATYNGQTLRFDAHLGKLEVESDKMRFRDYLKSEERESTQ